MNKPDGAAPLLLLATKYDVGKFRDTWIVYDETVLKGNQLG